MLKGRKGSSVQIQVRIDLDRSDIDAAAVEQCSERAGDHSFANAADHATSNQDVLHAVACGGKIGGANAIVGGKYAEHTHTLPQRATTTMITIRNTRLVLSAQLNSKQLYDVKTAEQMTNEDDVRKKTSNEIKCCKNDDDEWRC